MILSCELINSGKEKSLVVNLEIKKNHFFLPLINRSHFSMRGHGLVQL